jgi:hypothetical protein
MASEALPFTAFDVSPRARGQRMHDQLWAGAEFKAAEAEYFLDRMGKVLLPRRLDPSWHPAYHGDAGPCWQPDFYYYFDAFLGAARSVPDVIQKCFGDDRPKDWSPPLGSEEVERRKRFQIEFEPLYRGFAALPLSRLRVETFHWSGVPTVQAKARTVSGREFTGGPLEVIPSAASREFPPGTDPGVVIVAGKPRAVEPRWQDFSLEIPQGDGTTRQAPLFEECRSYLVEAVGLVEAARGICGRAHGDLPLTAPPSPRRV